MAKKIQKNKSRKFNIRSGDDVAVIAGNDLGVRGTVIRTVPDDNKVFVEDVNVRYVHEKAGSQGRRQGERVEKEMPVDASNVMLVCQNRDCEKFGKPVRIRRKRSGDSGFQRLCVKCGNAIESD